MNCPDSVKEGGLIAQAHFDCPNDSMPIGPPYCEYRDADVLTGDNSFPDQKSPGVHRVKPAYITISATTGGEWLIYSQPGLPNLMASNNKTASNTVIREHVATDQTKTITVYVWGRGNYKKGSNAASPGILLVAPPGSSSVDDAIGACQIEIENDDGSSAYIGRRTGHPYGSPESWNKNYHCTGPPGCAWD